MSLVYVRFRLDHPIFSEALDRVPAAELTWLRNEAREAGSELLVWADVPTFDTFSRALEADPTVASIERAIEVDGRHLCQCALSDTGTATDLYSILVETGSVVREATVTDDGWDCHFGFADSAALSRFFDVARDRGIDYEVHQVYEPRDGDALEDGLTAAQREALTTAMDIGYFDVPRKADLQTLGTELDISDTAASERVRRGVQTLIANAVTGESGR